MKIQALTPYNFNQRVYQKPGFITPIKQDTISFTSNCVKIVDSWQDFMTKFNKMYPGEKLEDVIKDTIIQGKNKIGQGTHKIVYGFDGIDDYVFGYHFDRLPVDETSSPPPLVKYENPFPEYNFGQGIAGNHENVVVMRKIKGESHSIADWRKKYDSVVFDKQPIAEQDAKTFLSKISEIEKMPIESYVDLARQIRYLTDKRIKMDLFNPNNIIVDTQNKKMTHFDLLEHPAHFYFLGADVNCTQDMINILSDALLHGEYMKALNEDDKKILFKTTKSVMEKCRIAGRIAGLSDDKTISYKTYEFVQSHLLKKRGEDNQFVESYNKFREIYNI